jgi:flagellar motility protein MotE (MotC chaperone)
MAKKDKDKKENKEELNQEDGAGSKIFTALIVIVIVVIWLAIFAVLIKLDVGNFGSEVLYPVLKDVPVVNMILPEPDESDDTESSGEYDNLTEANARIKELESQLAASSSADDANSSEIDDLKAEIKRLEKFEQNQKAFAERVKKFDENVVYNDKAPDTEEYKAYYEEIEPDNAEEIYREVCKDYEYSQEVKDQADVYSKMEPANAASILEEMSSDLSLVASILDNMQASKSAEILANMSTTTAAQITTKMTSMKKSSGN